MSEEEKWKTPTLGPGAGLLGGNTSRMALDSVRQWPLLSASKDSEPWVQPR